METFDEFIRRILKVVFWLFIPISLILAPIYFIVAEQGRDIFPISLYDPLAKPEVIFAIQNELFASPFFKVAVFPGFTFAALIATMMILFERKFLAKINLRVGPLYAGRFEGVLQPIADLFKLLFKEIIIPRKSDKLFFLATPLLIFAVSASLLSVIPLAPELNIVVEILGVTMVKVFMAPVVIAPSSIGLLIFFAAMGFFPLIVLIAGWASSNKFSFIGGLRALHQMISYEIPLILSAVGVVILSGSLDLMQIVAAQTTVWFIIPQILGAIIFYIAALAELERIPFDTPEADTEIVAGWLTEYSGMAFGLIQLAVYIKFYALAALFTVLFLGGWLGPAFLHPIGWFMLKTIIVMIVMIFPRAANPRVRMDMMVRIGWTWLIIFAIVNLLIAVAAASFVNF